MQLCSNLLFLQVLDGSTLSKNGFLEGMQVTPSSWVLRAAISDFEMKISLEIQAPKTL